MAANFKDAETSRLVRQDPGPEVRISTLKFEF